MKIFKMLSVLRNAYLTHKRLTLSPLSFLCRLYHCNVEEVEETIVLKIVLGKFLKKKPSKVEIEKRKQNE